MWSQNIGLIIYHKIQKLIFINIKHLICLYHLIIFVIVIILRYYHNFSEKTSDILVISIVMPLTKMLSAVFTIFKVKYCQVSNI